MFIATTQWIIAEGSREDLTGSSKLLFELFFKLFDIRNESSLKPKVCDPFIILIHSPLRTLKRERQMCS
jgi:hypothetical protein